MNRLIVLLCGVGMVFSLGFQVPVPIGNGDFVSPGVGNPPGGIGGCWDGFGVINGVVLADSECDGTNFCQPDVICLPAAVASPGGCEFRKTQDRVEVGTCVAATTKNCKNCPGGSEVFCASYEYFETRTATGTCLNSCGDWQLFFSGNCVP